VSRTGRGHNSLRQSRNPFRLLDNRQMQHTAGKLADRLIIVEDQVEADLVIPFPIYSSLWLEAATESIGVVYPAGSISCRSTPHPSCPKSALEAPRRVSLYGARARRARPATRTGKAAGPLDSLVKQEQSKFVINQRGDCIIDTAPPGWY
jgi:hypothetical protein